MSPTAVREDEAGMIGGDDDIAGQTISKPPPRAYALTAAMRGFQQFTTVRDAPKPPGGKSEARIAAAICAAVYSDRCRGKAFSPVSRENSHQRSGCP